MWMKIKKQVSHYNVNVENKAIYSKVLQHNCQSAHTQQSSSSQGNKLTNLLPPTPVMFH